jgi:hypothetical protein
VTLVSANTAHLRSSSRRVVDPNLELLQARATETFFASLAASKANSFRSGKRSGKVLLYWASKFDEQIVDLVISNVNHLRAGGMACDVLLGHYDLQKDAWLQRNESWYNDNVRWGINAQGWKVHLFRTIYNDKLAKGLNFDDYDWVWLFDEDLDITTSNITTLFADAEATGSLIVGPSFIQKSATRPNETESPFYPMNTPQSLSRFRYVPMIEVIMPMMRPCVLQYIFADDTFMAPQNHDWGMDHAWCSYISTKLSWTKETTCAILDDTGPIVHLNFKSTRDLESGKAATATTGNQAVAWVKEHHTDHFVKFSTAKWKKWSGYNLVLK